MQNEFLMKNGGSKIFANGKDLNYWIERRAVNYQKSVSSWPFVNFTSPTLGSKQTKEQWANSYGNH